MNQPYEPHRLVIQHLSVLESAPTIVEEVQRKMFAAIDEKIKKWAESLGDWEGVYDYLEDETTFKPNSWEKDQEDYYAFYTIGCSEKIDDYKYALSALIGVVPVQFGIYFVVNVRWVTRLSGRGMQAAWEKYLAEQFTKTNLEELGFQLQGNRLFLPILVDTKILADGYPDSIDDALEPIDAALKKIETAHPKIDALLKAAQQYSFAKPSQPA